MRVTAVRLFSNGMAHLEADATVTGDATLSIPVRTAAMSDVLKSLSVTDTSGGGGRIASVGYESPAGGVDAAAGGGAATALRLSPTQSLMRLLREAQGAAVVLTTAGVGDGTVTGTLVGTQTVSPSWYQKRPPPGSLAAGAPRVGPDFDALGPYGMVEPLDLDAADSSQDAAFPKRVALLLLTADGTVVMVPLVFVSAFRFADPTLTAAMRDVLGGRAADVTAERTLLTVRCVGAGERRIVARWCVEAPVWKTTYRLFTGGDDVDPAAAGGAEGDASTGAPAAGTAPPARGDDATGGTPAGDRGDGVAGGVAGSPPPPAPPTGHPRLGHHRQWV